MKQIVPLIILLVFGYHAQAQNMYIDSLRLAYANAKADTSRADILWEMANDFVESQPDSSLLIAEQALLLSRKNNYLTGELRSLKQIAEAYQAMGNYPLALQYYLERLQLDEKSPDAQRQTTTLLSIANLYQSAGDYSQALVYAKKGYELIDKYKLENYRWYSYMVFGDMYEKMNNLPQAKLYNKKAYDLAVLQNDSAWLGMCLNNTGNTFSKANMYDSALSCYYRGIPYLQSSNNESFLCETYLGISNVYLKTGLSAQAIDYAKRAMNLASTGNFSKKYLLACQLLTDIYKSNGHLDSAYVYLHLSVTIKDSLYNVDKIKQFQTLGFNETLRQQQSREAKQEFETKIKMYSLIGGMVLFVIVAFILYRNNKQKQAANILLKEQKQEIEATLGELKATQSQLIQSEKMASLGELTAGIAHEIQNPLNFVNNFSDVNAELIDEMKFELQSGNNENAIALANDIKDNEQKINHHGKRAEAIVKGMLQHSQSSTGKMQSTNINALADEYLRLAYHGLRAKDKSFNATLKTEYDTNIGLISLVSQDVGRVILNLVNNAFYTVSEKKKQRIDAYEPTVWVSTKKINEIIEIRISDNGNGISQKVVDKIFQPFFTTKPAGQGTGLGLSLSYDIIKAHKGEIKVESEEGKGTSFIIHLPLHAL